MTQNFYYDEKFYLEYGWAACYECDEMFYDLEKLDEHQKKCDDVHPID